MDSNEVTPHRLIAPQGYTPTKLQTGKIVLLYPDGTQIDRSTGAVVRKGTNFLNVLPNVMQQLMIFNLSPATALLQGSTSITTTDKAQPLSTGSVVIREVTIKADTGNTDPIYIGGQGVTDTNTALELVAGGIYTLAIDDLSKIYLYGTSGDILTYTYSL